MHSYIGIEDLAANALIELVENSSKERMVSVKMLKEYGTHVVKVLNSKKEHVILILSEERTNNFLYDYSDYFELIEGQEDAIKLRDGVRIEELWKKFRAYLSMDMLEAFMSKEAIKILGV
ncbi:hypothetical protein [Fusobacterium sp. PH5-44]|uniref:hypothetical protein n=1 Tax=unclassified Fusobacterium TaxID=2648384 RepID=UPI003D22D22B